MVDNMVGIITVFYSENFGSVLQAYALRRFLEEQGVESIFISTRNRLSSHSLKKMALSFCNQLVHGNIKNAVFAIQRYYNFQRIIKQFPYIELNDDSIRKIDTFIIGSDTVWDIDSPYFLQSKEVFWAEKIPGEKIIAYAPSVANSTPDRMRKLKYPVTTINKVMALSARDQYSYSVIRELTNNPIDVVCDPTILLGAEGYRVFEIEPILDNYIAVYLFEKINEEEVKRIMEIARRDKKKLVSIGKKLSWCDISVEPSIENFISYIYRASYVITNTFHGTIFSIIYNKDFLCLGYNKKKITELLGYLGLSDRVVYNAMDIWDIISSHIDYEKVNLKLTEMRDHSKEFLINNLQLQEV